MRAQPEARLRVSLTRMSWALMSRAKRRSLGRSDQEQTAQQLPANSRRLQLAEWVRDSFSALQHNAKRFAPTVLMLALRILR